MRHLRLIMLTIAILLGAVAYFMLWEDPPSPSTQKSAGSSLTVAASPSAALPVQTLRVQRRDLHHTLTLPGNVSPWLQATLYAKLPG
ncbi:MAG: hypothetical protein OEV08_08640, partial [Nitrospira sp.]|nr:hypothetical protein [Nitrospira sp.]